MRALFCLEVVEISREERDVYLIPQNFVDTGTILGGTVKLRNAVEAAVLAVGSAVPLFYLPLAFNIRLMIVIAVSVPLGVFGVVGIGGDSLTQFVAHWFRFMKHRRIVTPHRRAILKPTATGICGSSASGIMLSTMTTRTPCLLTRRFCSARRTATESW